MHDATRTGVAVILLSYNRPTMLDAAYDTVRATTGRIETILVDDGSDAFDVAGWAERNAVRHAVLGMKRTVDQRMTQPALGKLINTALDIAHGGLHVAAVTYLCDDDLFAPEWLDTVQATLARPDGPHVMRGRWRSFDDPLEHGPMVKPKKTRPTPMDFRQMTTGNFAHRAECYDEGFRWSEETIAVHDNTALWNLHQIHPLTEAVAVPMLAGYRREHAYNGANYTSYEDYAVGAYEWLSRGRLE
jgi:glycosyltransferase involved in cell wall biosynthesis